MEREPSYWFALAAEDKEHHAAVTRLTDRVLEAHIDWFGPEIRGWRAESPLDPYWKITGAVDDARKAGLSPRGNFSGKGSLEAIMYRAQLLLWQRAHVAGQRLDVGFLARDTDRKPRREGAQMAVESARWPFRVVLVFPHPEIEAWSIAAFRPTTRGAAARVAEMAVQLGYSPIEHPEHLTSTVAGGSADAKAIRDALFAGDADWLERWVEVDLDALRERGKNCGLADFLDEVRRVVVPLLDGSTARET